MSVEVLEIDGEDYVILPHPPDWKVKPRRTLHLMDGMKASVTGAESRLSLRDQATHSLAWEILPYDAREQRTLEQRILQAVASGLAVAPYWGRGMKLVANAFADSVLVSPTRWPFYVGQILFFQQPGAENWESWEFATVTSASHEEEQSELVLDAPLAAVYPSGAFCWPIIWGEFTAEDLVAFHLSRGSIQVRIRQRVPFPTEQILSCVGIYDLFETYEVGEITDPSTLIGGCGFELDADIQPNQIASVCRDFMEDYALGGIVGNDVNRGVGWAAPSDMTLNQVAAVCTDFFETYALGPVTGADLDEGFNWSGASDIATNA